MNKTFGPLQRFPVVRLLVRVRSPHHPVALFLDYGQFGLRLRPVSPRHSAVIITFLGGFYFVLFCFLK